MRINKKKKVSCLGKNLPLGKGINSGRTDRERYKNLKTLYAILYCYWLGTINNNVYYHHENLIPAMDMESIGKHHLYRLNQLELDHIENKGSHPERKFDIMNLQLITPGVHSFKTSAKSKDVQRMDYRHPDFIKFLKSIDWWD